MRTRPSSKKPDQLEIVDGPFPVRLTVAADGSPQDWKNKEMACWLIRFLGQGGLETNPAYTIAGKRACHLRPPSLYVASAPILARPRAIASGLAPHGGGRVIRARERSERASCLPHLVERGREDDMSGWQRREADDAWRDSIKPQIDPPDWWMGAGPAPNESAMLA